MRLVALIAVASITSNICLADNPDKQENSFANSYEALCLKHLLNLEGLRSKLADMPKLPPEKAKHFLHDNKGDVWPVPNKYGEMVLALPEGDKMCLLYARRVDALKVEADFKRLVADSPTPLVVSKLVKDENMETVANGPVHTISYEWSKPNAPISMFFTLSTATSGDAELQALASAALARN
jgi:hypothetical protein